MMRWTERKLCGRAEDALQIQGGEHGGWCYVGRGREEREGAREGDPAAHHASESAKVSIQVIGFTPGDPLHGQGSQSA